MKRFILSALLCACIIFSCTTPAFAYRLDSDGFTIHPNEETDQFWERYKQTLDKQGIYAESADNWNFCAEFHDGLLLIQEAITTLSDNGGYNNNYVDKNGNLVDLNQNRYNMMFSFAQGLAAGTKYNVDTAQGPTGGVAYVDTKGNEVIPVQGEWRSLRVSGIDYIGQFQNGRALVMRHPLGTKYIAEAPHGGQWESDWAGIEYAYIDTSGKLLTAWTLTQSRNTVINLPLYDKTGVWIGHRLGKKAADTPAASTPEAPQATYGQSTIKARGYIIENNIGYLLIDVTNHEKTKDQGDLFYVLYNKYKKAEGMISNTTDFLPTDYIRQIHYEAPANSTKTLRIPVGALRLEGELTEENRDAGWFESTLVADSRFVLAQAESETECTELVSFFKAAHDYGEMTLDYSAVDGVTILATPSPSTQRAAYLNQKLSALTSQF